MTDKNILIKWCQAGDASSMRKLDRIVSNLRSQGFKYADIVKHFGMDSRDFESLMQDLEAMASDGLL